MFATKLRSVAESIGAMYARIEDLSDINPTILHLTSTYTSFVADSDLQVRCWQSFVADSDLQVRCWQGSEAELLFVLLYCRNYSGEVTVKFMPGKMLWIFRHFAIFFLVKNFPAIIFSSQVGSEINTGPYYTTS